MIFPCDDIGFFPYIWKYHTGMELLHHLVEIFPLNPWLSVHWYGKIQASNWNRFNRTTWYSIVKWRSTSSHYRAVLPATTVRLLSRRSDPIKASYFPPSPLISHFFFSSQLAVCRWLCNNNFYPRASIYSELIVFIIGVECGQQSIKVGNITALLWIEGR